MQDRFANDYSDSDPRLPKWLIQQYHDLEKLLRYLWRQLFSGNLCLSWLLEVQAMFDGLRGVALKHIKHTLITFICWPH